MLKHGTVPIDRTPSGGARYI